ncbi:hypothetical protein J41TS4_49350 [Paenibacillus apis]|uniref:Uncharacterized protein n=1 Tax=Paenibacillus apis TaxID=1792174 RepID=A0A920CQD7_9BACL|nr:hypothetical protein J41TS4_49350 [Paenibacillus apis]
MSNKIVCSFGSKTGLTALSYKKYLEIMMNSAINRLTDLAMVGIINIIKHRSLSNHDAFIL